MIKRVVLSLFALAQWLALTSVAIAEPRRYELDPDQTRTSFIWFFGSDKVTGSMPPPTGDIIIDFQNERNSSVDVQIDFANIRAGFPFATQALKGAKMLDTETFPFGHYQSTSVRQSGTQAVISGNLALRDVTQPIELTAELFRQEGAEQGDLSKIAIRMQTSLNRNDFGVTGWADDVGPEVQLLVEAYLNQIE